MIKVEKTGNKMELEIKGDTHDLICEFDAVLKAMCEVLDRNLVKAASFTVEDLLHTKAWMISIPFRMQRIIKYKIFEDMTWQQVADRMGRRVTAESVKKEFQRFFEKN